MAMPRTPCKTRVDSIQLQVQIFFLNLVIPWGFCNEINFFQWFFGYESVPSTLQRTSDAYRNPRAAMCDLPVGILLLFAQISEMQHKSVEVLRFDRTDMDTILLL
jgi:hypothetical protein